MVVVLCLFVIFAMAYSAVTFYSYLEGQRYKKSREKRVIKKIEVVSLTVKGESLTVEIINRTDYDTWIDALELQIKDTWINEFSPKERSDIMPYLPSNTGTETFMSATIEERSTVPVKATRMIPANSVEYMEIPLVFDQYNYFMLFNIKAFFNQKTLSTYSPNQLHYHFNNYTKEYPLKIPNYSLEHPLNEDCRNMLDFKKKLFEAKNFAQLTKPAEAELKYMNRLYSLLSSEW